MVQFFVKAILSKLAFLHVKTSNSGYFVVWMDDGWSFSLDFRENNVDEVRGSWDGLNSFEIVKIVCGPWSEVISRTHLARFLKKKK